MKYHKTLIQYNPIQNLERRHKKSEPKFAFK